MYQTAETQLRILRNLPPGTEELRLSILQRLQVGLEAEVRRDARQQQPQMNPATGQPQMPTGPATSLLDVLGLRHLESVIDSSRMQGRGRPNADVQVCHAAIFRGLG